MQDIALFINGLFWSGRRQKLIVYIRRLQGAKCARRALVTWFITKILHGAAFYTLNRKNVNVMLVSWNNTKAANAANFSWFSSHFPTNAEGIFWFSSPLPNHNKKCVYCWGDLSIAWSKWNVRAVTNMRCQLLSNSISPLENSVE